MNTDNTVTMFERILVLALATSVAVAGDATLPRPPSDSIEFTPRYPLWSDGMSKRRWLHVPPGASIDKSDPDAWEFPRGTRAGHTGTLDPLATGVLVLCVGTATRLTEYVQDLDKTYRAGVLLGARSDTDDADGQVQPVAVSREPSPAEVATTLRARIGMRCEG